MINRTRPNSLNFQIVDYSIKLKVLYTMWYILLHGTVLIHKDTLSIFVNSLRTLRVRKNQKHTFFTQESDLEAKTHDGINSDQD